MTTRRVVILRHAKSSWKDNLPDHERPLSGRGRRDGLAAGALLVRLGIVPDRVYCSTSVRTRQTLERLALGGAQVDPVEFRTEIYHAGGEVLLEVIRQIPDRVQTALVMGHWPAVQDVVSALASFESNEHWRSLLTKFPTSALAIIDLPGSWAQAGDRTGALQSFHIPRGTR